MRRLLTSSLLSLSLIPASFAQEETPTEVLSIQTRQRICVIDPAGSPERCSIYLSNYDCKTGLMRFDREDGTDKSILFQGKPPLFLCQAAQDIYD